MNATRTKILACIDKIVNEPQHDILRAREWEDPDGLDIERVNALVGRPVFKLTIKPAIGWHPPMLPKTTRTLLVFHPTDPDRDPVEWRQGSLTEQEQLLAKALLKLGAKE